MGSPVKSIHVGCRSFDISGLSEGDPYFASVTDDFEPEFETLCNELIHDDYICVDIGANLGLKSLLLSQHVPNGRVIAVEAAPTVAKLLEQNIENSSAKNIIVVKSAIGDSDGKTRFAENSAYGYISPDGVEVPVQTLSSLVAALNLERLDFVKIDVEGYEFPILRTSIELLNQHRSLVLFEFNTWCQVGLSGVHPKKFIDWTLSQFAHVYAVRRNAGGNYLERVPEDGARTFLHTNMVHDALVTDLLVTNYEERLLPPLHGLRSKLKMIVAERDSAVAEGDGAIAERDRAITERDRALAEKKSEKLPVDLSSWRATGRWFASLTAARIRERLFRR
jgi:FkbM family methyltransferase